MMGAGGCGNIFLILIRNQGICFIVFYTKHCSLIVNGRVRSGGPRSGVCGANRWRLGVWMQGTGVFSGADGGQ